MCEPGGPAEREKAGRQAGDTSKLAAASQRSAPRPRPTLLADSFWRFGRRPAATPSAAAPSAAHPPLPRPLEDTLRILDELKWGIESKTGGGLARPRRRGRQRQFEHTLLRAIAEGDLPLPGLFPPPSPSSLFRANDGESGVPGARFAGVRAGGQFCNSPAR